jgi:hypothetical protein
MKKSGIIVRVCAQTFFLYPCAEIRDNHMGLVSAILPCPYPEIRDNHMGLVSTIRYCQFAEIRDNQFGFGRSHFTLPICRNQR